MANLQQLTGRSEVGAIKPWGKTTAPDGYVLCDGASLVRTGTYADLFAVIGTTYGTADGTHFNVPDLQGKAPQGYDGNTYNLAGTGGANTVTVSVTNNQAVNSTLANNQAVTATSTVANNQAVTVTGNIANTSLTTAQLASHNHNWRWGSGQAPSGTNKLGMNFPGVNSANSAPPAGGSSNTAVDNAGSGTGHTHTHTLAGTMTGNVAVTTTGTLTGNVALSNALTGAVTASGTNSFSPYVVVNYIIRY